MSFSDRNPQNVQVIPNEKTNQQTNFQNLNSSRVDKDLSIDNFSSRVDTVTSSITQRDPVRIPGKIYKKNQNSNR